MVNSGTVPKTAAALSYQATALAHLGDVPAARALLDQVSQAPTFESLSFLLISLSRSTLFLRSLSNQQAFHLLDSTTSTTPSQEAPRRRARGWVLLALGRVEVQDGRYDEAEAAFLSVSVSSIRSRTAVLLADRPLILPRSFLSSACRVSDAS